jgi:hypothetical protein
MALIPYEAVPDKEDPPFEIANHRVRELYCGDARCDCVTANLVVDDVPLAVDLGTSRVDFLSKRVPQTQRDAVFALLQGALTPPGALSRLRAHYAATRKYGLLHHFLFKDWRALKPGQAVAWAEVFPQEGPQAWPVGTGGEAQDKPRRLALLDSYCVDPKCDCHQVLFETHGVQGERMEQAVQGVVICDLRKQEPRVREHSPQVDPNQLCRELYGLLQQPAVVSLYRDRYRTLRELLIPLIAQQRRRGQPGGPLKAGRNDLCPCGSGKKFKKCHGS